MFSRVKDTNIGPGKAPFQCQILTLTGLLSFKALALLPTWAHRCPSWPANFHARSSCTVFRSSLPGSASALVAKDILWAYQEHPAYCCAVTFNCLILKQWLALSILCLSFHRLIANLHLFFHWSLLGHYFYLLF